MSTNPISRSYHQGIVSLWFASPVYSLGEASVFDFMLSCW